MRALKSLRKNLAEGGLGVGRGTNNKQRRTARVALDDEDDFFSDFRARTQPQRRAFEMRVSKNERLLRRSLTALCRSAPIRSARMAWLYFKTDAAHAALLSSAAAALSVKVLGGKEDVDRALEERSQRHRAEDEEDDTVELNLVRRILELGAPNASMSALDAVGGHLAGDGSLVSGMSNMTPVVAGVVEIQDGPGRADTDGETKRRCERAVALASQSAGRWDSTVALSIMEAAGVEDAEVRVEETTRDLRLVRKYAIGLRDNVERCMEAVNILEKVVLGGDTEERKENEQQSVVSGVSRSSAYGAMKINRKREVFLSALASVFSGTLSAGLISQQHQRGKSRGAMPSLSILSGAGIDTSDPFGWAAAVQIIEMGQKNPKAVMAAKKGKCGEVLVEYQKVRDNDVSFLLEQMHELLSDYQRRVEGIESFVYMHCVGIQLEKHFSKSRSEALAAWEKKTDITTAINIATRKRLPLLVNELKAKLDDLSPSISHTTVKEAKERHLTSKALKSDLQNLANRRFQRAKEVATERVITIMRLWAQHEEKVAKDELRVLGEAIREVEKNLTLPDIEADGGAHLYVRPTYGKPGVKFK